MLISVIEVDYTIANEDFNTRYIGSPCRSFEEARELCAAHTGYGNELTIDRYVNDGVRYFEVDHYTGELIREFFVKAM